MKAQIGRATIGTEERNRVNAVVSTAIFADQLSQQIAAHKSGFWAVLLLDVRRDRNQAVAGDASVEALHHSCQFGLRVRADRMLHHSARSFNIIWMSELIVRCDYS